MSWLYSRVLVEEYSAATCSDGEPCAPSNLTPMPLGFCSPGKMMGVSRLSLFGATFAPLTEDRGEAVLMSFLAAFPVRIFPSPGVVPESMAHAPASGHIWQELSVKYDLDSSSWRTHRCLFDEDLPWSSVTLPRWGTMRNGECWERTMSERPISASGSGLWPTPLSQDAKHSGYAKSGPGMANKLSYAVVKWPTPNARDWKDTGESQGTRKSPNLGTMVHRTPLWPTPTASTGGPEPDGKTGRKLVTQVQQKTQAGGALNPTWVEWLMGWPIGWTDLEPLATDKFQQWQRQRGCC
jgi:hypothetical protein